MTRLAHLKAKWAFNRTIWNVFQPIKEKWHVFLTKRYNLGGATTIAIEPQRFDLLIYFKLLTQNLQII